MSDKVNTQPAEGSMATAISLPSSQKKEVKLSDLKGKPVVVYFYPKDDTPGCTVEAQGFQQYLDEFEALGAVVLGISPDGVESHCKFADKFGLEYHLLADEDHAVAEKYGVWVEKNMYGKTSWGVQRATFLVDRDGKVAKAWPKVKPEGHAEAVLEAINAL